MIFSTDLLIAYLLVLARVAGIFALAPLPGARLFPPAAKVVLSLLLAALLVPLARVRAGATLDPWTMGAWMVREAGFGVAIAVALLFLTEMLGFAAQMLGFQAGYSYINTVDPSTQVDATILNVLLTLLGGLLLFAFDLHLHVVRALARSLETIPVGEFALQPRPALELARLGGAVFETAVRLAFPVVALLLLLDIALALLSYVNARMQLLTLSFPIKMIVTMGALYVVVQAAPRLFHELAGKTLARIYEVAAR